MLSVACMWILILGPALQRTKNRCQDISKIENVVKGKSLSAHFQPTKQGKYFHSQISVPILFILPINDTLNLMQFFKMTVLKYGDCLSIIRCMGG